ncbi:Ras GTPase, variant 2 [Orbilia ellipsospora]
MANLDILDTAGQEDAVCEEENCQPDCRKRRRQHGYIFVYDITDRVSFEEMQPLQESILRHRQRQNISSEDSFPMILVGNKSDLEASRQVFFEEGASLAEQLGCKFVETSAKDKVNVEEIFFDLVRGIRKALPSRPSSEIEREVDDTAEKFDYAPKKDKEETDSESEEEGDSSWPISQPTTKEEPKSAEKPKVVVETHDATDIEKSKRKELMKKLKGELKTLKEHHHVHIHKKKKDGDTKDGKKEGEKEMTRDMKRDSTREMAREVAKDAAKEAEKHGVRGKFSALKKKIKHNKPT